MPAAYPRNVLRAIAATDQHAALSRLFGFVQLAFVELHRAGVFGLGAAGIEMDLGLGRGTDQQQGSDSDDFFHDDGFWLNDGAHREGRHYRPVRARLTHYFIAMHHICKLSALATAMLAVISCRQVLHVNTVKPASPATASFARLRVRN
jgi:hypothetical protein